MKQDLRELQFSEIRAHMDNARKTYDAVIDRHQDFWKKDAEGRLFQVLDMGLKGKYIFPDKLRDAKRTIATLHRIRPTDGNMLALAVHVRGD